MRCVNAGGKHRRSARGTLRVEENFCISVLLAWYGEVFTLFGLSLSKPVHPSTSLARTDFKFHLAASHSVNVSTDGAPKRYYS